MPPDATIRGSCLCGATRFEITDAPLPIGMCHCSKCRKVSGTASNATLIAGTDRFRWLAGEDRLTRYSMADGWGTCRCSVCGSPMPMLHDSGGAYMVPAGSLDDDPGVRVAGHIFVGSKAAWDEIAGAATQWIEGFDGARAR
jgi:hypothetical protein